MIEEREKSVSLSSLERVLDVIEYLDAAPRETSIQELSRSLGINKSTVYRILNTLCLRGYIVQNPETKKYALSMAFFHIGIHTKRKMSVAQRLSPYLPYLEELCKKYEENVNVSTIDFAYKKRMKVINLYNLKTKYMLERPERELDSMEAHTSAAGKCLLAYSPEHFLENFQDKPLEKVTAYTISDWPTLQDELEKIRRQGYAECADEHVIGISCVAVPVFSLNGNDIKAAISISGDSGRIQKEKSAEMISDLYMVAKKLAAAF